VSLFFRPQPEQRSVSTEWIVGTPLEGSQTKSGVSVTSNRAMQHGAMWSSVHLLASIVANLPVDVFRGVGESKTPVLPAPPLVATPSRIVTRREWIYQAMVSLLLRGNAIGSILEKDSLQRPKVVEWLDPDAVTIKQASSVDRPTYWLGTQELYRDNVIHMRAYLRPGSAVGMSPVEYHAEKIGLGLAAEKFGAEFYGGGGHPTALFQNKTQTIDPAKAATIKERILGVMKGRREPLVLGSDWDYKPLQVSPTEAAFIAAQGYTDSQIAHLYGPGLAEVLGYTQAGSSLTYSNRVDRSLDLMTYTVMPWVSKFEDMWTANIAQPQTARMNVSALLRADPKSQMEMFRTAREIGLYNIDEERGLLDLPPLPDGQGQDYTPLKVSAPPAAPEGDEDANE
jgi:HK97 family phage portal protein